MPGWATLARVPSLLETDHVDAEPEDVVAAAGRILQRFDHRSQDSGNISWVLATDDGDFFVKTAGQDVPPPPGAPVPYFGHTDRVGLLRNAVAIARSTDHPALARLRNVIETPSGPMLVYDRAPGELLHVRREQRTESGRAYQRFAHLPADAQLSVFDQLLASHVRLESAGWVAVDLYDGCLMVDMEIPSADAARLTLIDLDTYHRGPFVNDMGRMFGATRFMAPEEFERGARIDARTTVFTLGRLLRHFGTRLTEDLDAFTGGEVLAGTVDRATRNDRAGRFGTVDEFAAAWRSAR